LSSPRVLLGSLGVLLGFFWGSFGVLLGFSWGSPGFLSSCFIPPIFFFFFYYNYFFFFLQIPPTSTRRATARDSWANTWPGRGARLFWRPSTPSPPLECRPTRASTPRCCLVATPGNPWLRTSMPASKDSALATWISST